MTGSARLAVDIGGTFTDFALDHAGGRTTLKVSTTPKAPELAVLEGLDTLLAQTALAPDDLSILIHGTTLATNAIIERKGACTAMLVTEGFRDSVEMAYEHRFEQYDIMMDRPDPLVPRDLRLPVHERIDARGNVVVPLDVGALGPQFARLSEAGIEAVAVCLLHSYMNDAHERRLRELVLAQFPTMAVTLSCEVCPEIREYERWSTTCANAYVQPAMDGYLGRLTEALHERGIDCPFFMITSAGGLTEIETARRFPVRLVESGPAGGAILAASVAGECGYERIVSFDMGGTTAKICLIDDGVPQHSRLFEVAREYRFLKGSGLPIRIPVIDMVEIGAGGGSIARVDAMSRIRVGPDSVGSEPGPACYDRGGTLASVTDGDLLLGRIAPEGFAGGTIAIAPEKAEMAVSRDVAEPLSLPAHAAALGISEVVEENMANAARIHAVERGQALRGRTMIAFGGAAPLHAARLAEKLEIARVVIPVAAGVGSAVGFLLAPVAYEVVRSRFTRLDGELPSAALNALRESMHEEAERVVRRGDPERPLLASWTADMRYQGQGHEITVPIPTRPLREGDAAMLSALFVALYEEHFGRSIAGLAVEVMSWSLRLATETRAAEPITALAQRSEGVAAGRRRLVDPGTGTQSEVPVYQRNALRPGAAVTGPCVITESETTTVVSAAFTAHVNAVGHLVLDRRGAA